MALLTRYQRLQVAVAARCDPRSVEAAYGGKKVRGLTMIRIVEAARGLRLPEPAEVVERATV